MINGPIHGNTEYGDDGDDVGENANDDDDDDDDDGEEAIRELVVGFVQSNTTTIGVMPMDL